MHNARVLGSFLQVLEPQVNYLLPVSAPPYPYLYPYSRIVQLRCIRRMFDVPDPLDVHVLLLSHEFMYNIICLPHFWPCFFVWQTVHVFYVPKTHRWWFTLFNLLQSAGPGRCFIVYWLILFNAAMSQTALCLSSLSKGSFEGATSLVLKKQLSQFLHACFTWYAA